MADSIDFAPVFTQLKEILMRHAPSLVVATDEPDHYYLNTTHIQKNKTPLFFASVQIKKNYVSYHLLPLYIYPEMRDRVSPALLARMQGKACFNFKKCDADIFQELAQLTQEGFDKFQADAPSLTHR